ncbi:unnamed protein product [Echinostoma caproni]|uniref:Uncharacterized protein n=1 Tax=Echinostoma caproni TaxID=27848 RepID=A0A183AQA3_9TREM|nr:unnamed protein product [Echinostoma caproni]
MRPIQDGSSAADPIMPKRSTGRGQTKLSLTRPAAWAPPGFLRLSTPDPEEVTPANKHDEGQFTGRKTSA